uniref:Putative 2,3-bisphosphoglycerate-independent phosphoglycerate mutase n=1 Tax=Helianthus annuus TaxID=4232 RepID=A0A251V5Z6_HELAN
MGAGLAMAPGDIAFKSNFATFDEKTGVVTSRRADRHFEEEGPILCAALDKMKLPSYPEYEVTVSKASRQYRRSQTHCKRCQRIIQRDSKILVAHPLNQNVPPKAKNIANIVLLRGCGIRIEVPAFEKNHGLRPCMVAPTKIIAGLGLSLGIDILEAPGATGDYRTLLTSKATAIANALSAPVRACPNVFVPGEDEHKPGVSDGYDFGFLHVKAIDDVGHDKATVFKVKGLEAVDKAIGQLARLLWEAESAGQFQFFLCVTEDHSTPG